MVVIEKMEKYYTASVADLPCCYAKARTLEKLIINTRNAIKHYLKEEDDIPKVNFVGVRMMELRDRRKKRFTVVIERDGKYYIAYIPSLPGCHTYAKTISRLLVYIKEAAVLCLDTGVKVKKTDFVGVQLIEV